MKTAKIIRELRENEQLSQYKLAELTEISQSAIARWELGQTEPTASALNNLANFFNVSTDFLLGRTDDDLFVPSTVPPASKQKTEVQELFDQLDFGEQQRILGRMEDMLEKRGIKVDKKIS